MLTPNDAAVLIVSVATRVSRPPGGPVGCGPVGLPADLVADGVGEGVELLAGDEVDRRGAGHPEGDGLEEVLERPAGLGRDPDLGVRVAHAEHVDQFLDGQGRPLLGV
ncbi:hypothetical protein [Frankia sp. Cj3]|uniref:hypothetical protein n=1 Tax=Frankia sp. Cj3 TaxID=2880976 RepID=UPI001EF4288A|nr:hypothetical protein [Frankia sp. Cj3]